jgi:hypothetical protein
MGGGCHICGTPAASRWQQPDHSGRSGLKVLTQPVCRTVGPDAGVPETGAITEPAAAWTQAWDGAWTPALSQHRKPTVMPLVVEAGATAVRIETP